MIAISPRSFVVLTALLTCPPAFACDSIHSANESLQERLELGKSVQRGFDSDLNNVANYCQANAAQLSKYAAQTATAESCVTLREHAAFDRELTSLSEECAARFQSLQEAMQTVRDEVFEPFRKSIQLIVDEDQQDAHIQRICPAHIAETVEVLEPTNKLLDRSKAAIQNAKANHEKFLALAAQTKQFETTTQNGYDRCASEQTQNLAAQPKGGAADHAPVSAGHTPRPASTITGIEEDQKKQKR